MCLFKQDMRLTFFITTDTLLRKSYGELRATRGIGHHHAGEGTVLADSCARLLGERGTVRAAIGLESRTSEQQLSRSPCCVAGGFLRIFRGCRIPCLCQRSKATAACGA